MTIFKKLSFFTLTTISFLLITTQFNKTPVRADDVLNLTPKQYESYLYDTIDSDIFYQDIYNIINTYFASETPYTTYEEMIGGKSEYRILEITTKTDPESYEAVSDFKDQIDLVESIFNKQLKVNTLSNKYFIKNLVNFDLDVMTVKQFVDNRDDLKAHYDTIIFSAGDYNPERTKNCNTNDTNCLNTIDILNDLTHSKANLILNAYIQKGLPVFFHESVFNRTDTVIYQTFNHLLEINSNVFQVDYTEESINQKNHFYKTLALMALTELHSTKPYFSVTNKPIDYYTDSTQKYNVNEDLIFTIDLINKETADLYFYLDVNQNGVFENKELSYLNGLNKGNNQFKVNIPSVMTGLIQYKIVVSYNGLDRSFINTIRVSGESKTIQVLTIQSEMIENRSIISEDFFNNNDDYAIEFDYCSYDEFSRGGNGKGGGKGKGISCSHNSVMEDYDVILLGQDIFSKNNNKHVFDSIQEEITNGKPFIFTSSITKGSPDWINYFSNDLGLTNDKTGLYKSNNDMNNLQIVNKHYYNAYPYDLTSNNQLSAPQNINYAFNEMYQLNLDNQELVPLMNMYNSNDYRLDKYDSYNNYYYMKNDNLVYLNIGSNPYKTMTNLEHQLLANAIVNSYIEQNTTDITYDDLFFIDPSNRYDHAILNVDESIDFSFSVNSTKDQEFTYNIYMDNTIIETNTVTNGQTIMVDINDLPKPANNSMIKSLIQVEVIDQNNRRQVYQFSVFITNYNNYVSINKQLNYLTYDSENYIKLNNSYSLSYRITLNDLLYDHQNISSDQLPDQLVIQDLDFKDILPSGIYTNPNNDDFVIETVNGETIIQKSLVDVIYKLDPTTNSYKPNMRSIQLNLNVAANQVNSYALDNTTVDLEGIGNDVDTIYSNTVSFKAVKELTSDMITFNFDNYLFVPLDSNRIYFKDFVDLNQEETMIKNIVFTSSTGNIQIDQNNRYYYEPDTTGTHTIQVKVTDVFDNSFTKEFTIKTYASLTSIQLDNLDLKVGDKQTLPLTLSPNVKIENVIITKEDPDTIVSFVKNDYTIEVTGLSAGTTKVTVVGYDTFGNELVTEAMINVYNSIYFTNGSQPMYLFVGEELPFPELTILSENKNVTYTSSNSSIADYNNQTNTVLAKIPGTAIIQASIINNQNEVESVALLVYVTERLNNNSGFNENITTGSMYVYAETLYNLEDMIVIYPENTNYATLDISFTVNGQEVSSDNMYTFAASGEYTITVTIQQDDIIVSKSQIIDVKSPEVDPISYKH